MGLNGGASRLGPVGGAGPAGRTGHPQSHEQRQQRDRGGVRPHGGVARRRERNGENGPYRGPEGPPRDGRTASKAPQPAAYREQPQPAAKDRRHGQGDVLAADETKGPPPPDREEVDPGAQGALEKIQGMAPSVLERKIHHASREGRLGKEAQLRVVLERALPTRAPRGQAVERVREVRVEQPRQRGTQEAAERCTQEEGGRDGHACDREPAKRTLTRKGESRDERRQYEHRARTCDEGGGNDAQSQGWYPRGERRARESAKSRAPSARPRFSVSRVPLDKFRAKEYSTRRPSVPAPAPRRDVRTQANRIDARAGRAQIKAVVTLRSQPERRSRMAVSPTDQDRLTTPDRGSPSRSRWASAW